MCKCTPSIRTPFCGKVGCEWPEQKTAKHTPEQTEELLRSKAEELLRPLDIAIKSFFPTAEFRRIMWIAVFEQVKARINAAG